MHRKTTQQTRHANNQAGFTIVELMIATMVFSVILVVITMGVMYFTHSYYKGVYATMTQNAARDISDSVVQAVQFGTGEPDTYVDTGDTSLSHFCAGGYVFVFKLGEEYETGNAATTGMYMQPMSGSCDASVAPVSPLRRQLLGNHMRVAYLNFEGNAGLYTLDLKVAYGGSDLLSDPSGKGAELQCNLGTGSQYCAVARYTTSVSPRKT